MMEKFINTFVLIVSGLISIGMSVAMWEYSFGVNIFLRVGFAFVVGLWSLGMVHFANQLFTSFIIEISQKAGEINEDR